MARKVHLNITQVEKLKKEEGLHCVSDNLYLQVRKGEVRHSIAQMGVPLYA